jgi:hypothetical protein
MQTRFFWPKDAGCARAGRQTAAMPTAWSAGSDALARTWRRVEAEVERAEGDVLADAGREQLPVGVLENEADLRCAVARKPAAAVVDRLRRRSERRRIAEASAGRCACWNRVVLPAPLAPIRALRLPRADGERAAGQAGCCRRGSGRQTCGEFEQEVVCRARHRQRHRQCRSSADAPRQAIAMARSRPACWRMTGSQGNGTRPSLLRAWAATCRSCARCQTCSVRLAVRPPSERSASARRRVAQAGGLGARTARRFPRPLARPSASDWRRSIARSAGSGAFVRRLPARGILLAGNRNAKVVADEARPQSSLQSEQ